MRLLYIDDIIIFSKDYIENFEHQEDALSMLEEADIHLKLI